MPARRQRPSIGVIYTGGTFGMVPSERGYVPTEDLPERAEAALRDHGPVELPAFDWIDSGQPAVDSGAIEPRFWFELAQVVAAAAEAHDGFVVVHGTDTLAYTGSALSFLLAGLERPVVVTGSSRPLGERGSDALDNLLHALRVAAAQDCHEVTLAFGERLLRANRATKRHGTAAEPFDSPCFPPLAELGHSIHWRRVEPPPAVEPGPLPRAAWGDTRVAMLPVHPGIEGNTIRALRETGIDALVLEGYAAGIGPGGNTDFVRSIRECTDAGIVCGAVSQSREGYVQLGRYALSTPLADAGLVGGADMTREAALTKLHYLLGQGLAASDVAAAFGRNLRGELSER
ncbi:MAG: asparaginase domain-containing protein [Halofilum sp. (in: g-proteobacteria)]|nr:asparaginase domain-containing protein [Halofilum sp. (in: g-proteobacteria)]